MVTFSCGTGIEATLEAVNIFVSDNFRHIKEKSNYFADLQHDSLNKMRFILTSSFQSSVPHSSVAVLQAPEQEKRNLMTGVAKS